MIRYDMGALFLCGYDVYSASIHAVADNFISIHIGSA